MKNSLHLIENSHDKVQVIANIFYTHRCNNAFHLLMLENHNLIAVEIDLIVFAENYSSQIYFLVMVTKFNFDSKTLHSSIFYEM